MFYSDEIQITDKSAVLYMLCRMGFELKIKCPPQVYVKRNEGEPLCIFNMELFRLEIAEGVHNEQLIYDAAYCMRKIYQQVYHSYMLYTLKSRDALNDYDFYMQPSELDAHGYAYGFVRRDFEYEPNMSHIPEIARFAIITKANEIFSDVDKCISHIPTNFDKELVEECIKLLHKIHKNNSPNNEFVVPPATPPKRRRR